MEEVVNLAALEGSVDFSMFGMFLKSDWVVKLVIVLLIIFSIQSWKIIIQKILLVNKQRKISKQFENHFWSGVSLDELYQRLYTSLDLSIANEDSNLNKGLSFLASSGSVAPFIGLFGTVWGIMNSFQAIAIAQNTNLAVVAPGIAEALFVTALGLFVAIPSTAFYNMITSKIDNYLSEAESFGKDLVNIISRQVK